MKHGNYLKSTDFQVKHSFIQRKIIQLIKKKTGRKNHNALYIEYLLKYVRGNNLSVLEIGPGEGQCIISNENKRISKKTVLELDDTYKNNFTRNQVEYLNEDISSKTSLKDNSFDLIIMNHVLEHISNYNKTLSEMKRILKKGGCAAIRVPDIEKVKFKFFDDYTHVKAYTKKSISRMFKAFGFKVEFISSLNNNYFMISHLFSPLIKQENLFRGKEIFIIVRK